MIPDNILNILLLFFIFCFIGWVWECSYISITEEKKFTNRGFLNGPYIPIYGFGGLSIYLCLQKYGTGAIISMQSIKIYFIGLVFATVLEYITSFLMEKIFKARWWDYTNYFLNVNGRVCLLASLFWGLLSVVSVQFLNPLLLNKIESLTHDIKIVVSTALVTVFILDLFITINSIVNIQKRITMILAIENNKLQALKEKIDSVSVPEEYKQLISDYKAKLYNISNPFTTRLVKAFPHLKFESKDRQTIFTKIRESKILKKKGKK